MGAPTATRRFTVEEYHRMAEAGILTEDDRVELVRGEVVEMEPIGSRHAACVSRLNALFSPLHGQCVVAVQNPVRLDEQSEPEPDVALLRPDPDFYARRHPGPEDVLLAVEVAETSAEYDREVKLPLYAAAGVPEAWLVDLAADRILRARDPSADGYRRERTLRRSDTIMADAFPGMEIPVGEILG
jgi:Uma2 family endonuclease